MVNEALRERANLLEIAPHLSQPLPIMLPIYKYVKSINQSIFIHHNEIDRMVKSSMSANI